MKKQHVDELSIRTMPLIIVSFPDVFIIGSGAEAGRENAVYSVLYIFPFIFDCYYVALRPRRQ